MASAGPRPLSRPTPTARPTRGAVPSAAASSSAPSAPAPSVSCSGPASKAALARALLPITLRDPTGLSDLIPAAGRFRIYSVTAHLPHRSVADYQLTVAGLVDRPSTLTYDDLRLRLPQTSLKRDFQCVTGWRVEGVHWSGVLLRDVARPRRASRRERPTSSSTASTARTPRASRWPRPGARTSSSPTRCSSAPVTREHGGPVRLYVAPMYGYKSLKWLDRIEVVDALPDDNGYWEQRGYDREAGSAPATAATRTEREHARPKRGPARRRPPVRRRHPPCTG